jgi:hypothetical protein
VADEWLLRPVNDKVPLPGGGQIGDRSIIGKSLWPSIVSFRQPAQSTIDLSLDCTGIRTHNAKAARYEPFSQAPLLADRKGLQRNTVLRLEVCLVLLDLLGRERDIVH